jgi:hypothetical protein
MEFCNSAQWKNGHRVFGGISISQRFNKGEVKKNSYSQMTPRFLSLKP